MNKFIKVARGWWNYRRAVRGCRRDFDQFQQMAGPSSRLGMQWSERQLCLDDRDCLLGFDRHYFYHLAWAARVLQEVRPDRHVDVSSHALFAAVVSAFVPMAYFEFHQPNVSLDRLDFGHADLVAGLPLETGRVASISCMHVVEHIGLGRYGERLDPDGDRQAMAELRRVVAPGGQLLLVVPVGRPRVVFNAHRVYGYEHVREAFADLALAEFALIPDDEGQGGLIRFADPARVRQQEYACGCFRFVRPA